MKCSWTFLQTIALPEENLFYTVERAGAWSHQNDGGWTSAAVLAFACPVCLKVWGILGEEGTEVRFVTSPCIKHATQTTPGRVDGSLLYSYSVFEHGNFDRPLLEALPLELLRRELFLHLDYFEKKELGLWQSKHRHY